MAFDAVKQRIADARERSPLLDHVVRTVQHYGSVGGSQQAAGVTYFGFLSVFPVLALAFFVVGYVARVAPGARDALATAVGQVMPGLIGDPPHGISLHDIQDKAGAVGLVGILGVLFAGLGWLSALRTALTAVFEEPATMQPNFVFGKLRDLAALTVLGVVLIGGVGVSGGISKVSGRVVDLLHLGSGLGWLVPVIAVLVGLLSGVLLFYLMFRLLARPPVPSRSLWQGALLAGIAFEALKQLSGFLLGITRGQPAFQVFGMALILLVWINYFSQVTLYAASWAYTSRAAREWRDVEGRSVSAAEAADWSQTTTQRPEDVSFGTKRQLKDRQLKDRRVKDRATGAALGAAGMLGAVVLTKRKRRPHS